MKKGISVTNKKNERGVLGSTDIYCVDSRCSQGSGHIPVAVLITKTEFRKTENLSEMKG